MSTFSKTIIAASIAAASLFSANASAGLFEVSPPGYANFEADRIGGGYIEVATFNAATGTFNVSLFFQGGNFYKNDVLVPAGDTGLGVTYGLYGVYKASGTFSAANGVTTFNFLPGSGELSLMLDTNRNTIKTANAANGSSDFSFTNTSDDVELAFGDPLTGEGTLNSGLSTCGTAAGINCGSFGSTTSFNLTGPGSEFFVGPNPFYNLSFQSGQLTGFTPTQTQTISGSLDVVFLAGPTDVPEPASVGLLGLGMLGLYAARRRNKKAA